MDSALPSEVLPARAGAHKGGGDALPADAATAARHILREAAVLLGNSGAPRLLSLFSLLCSLFIVHCSLSRTSFDLRLLHVPFLSFIVHCVHSSRTIGSYMVQSKLGDFDEVVHGEGIDYLRNFAFVQNQTDELLEKIAELHRTHKGMFICSLH